MHAGSNKIWGLSKYRKVNNVDIDKNLNVYSFLTTLQGLRD